MELDRLAAFFTDASAPDWRLRRVEKQGVRSSRQSAGERGSMSSS